MPMVLVANIFGLPSTSILQNLVEKISNRLMRGMYIILHNFEFFALIMGVI
jgi:hypothetical protein